MASPGPKEQNSLEAAWLGPLPPPNSVIESCRDAGLTLNTYEKLLLLQNSSMAAFDVIIVGDLSQIGQVVAAFQNSRQPPAIVAALNAQTKDQGLDAIAAGAHDVFSTAQEDAEIAFTLQKAVQRNRSSAKPIDTLRRIDRSISAEGIIFVSQEMRSIFDTIEKIADFSTTVLIQGESGTGKELIARAIHNNSPRAKKPFVAINCGAIPENLLESELFGHRKGAFTDATKDKKGLFEEADGGTVLLDEIGELPIHLQVKLLRVLQEREIRRVGDTNPISINVRVLGATLRDLEQDVLDGRFRDDLYYRLNVITIRVPPLRERREDVPVLVDYFLKKNHEKLGLPVYAIDDSALDMLLKHDWPGNIRELENCIERAMILCEGTRILPENLPKSVRDNQSGRSTLNISDDNLSIKEHVRTLEEALIRKALEKTNGNRTHAAKLLEISHRTLLYKLKEYGIADAE